MGTKSPSLRPSRKTKTVKKTQTNKVLDLDVELQKLIKLKDKPKTVGEANEWVGSLRSLVGSYGWSVFESLLSEKIEDVKSKMLRSITPEDLKPTKTMYEFYKWKLETIEMILQLPKKSIELEKLRIDIDLSIDQETAIQ